MECVPALDDSLPVLWLHLAQTICKKSVTQETSIGYRGSPRCADAPMETAMTEDFGEDRA